jgi:carbamoyl-phosphate synthase large subunit
MRQIASKLARALEITGPFNVQFLAKDNVVKVIECNLRASRSFPFVSKVLGFNFAEEATRRMLGARDRVSVENMDLDHVGVKVSMFSFARLQGVDPLLGVEMSSTGEVGCLGTNVHEALLQALMSTGFRVPKAGVLLSLGPVAFKYSFTEDARVLASEFGLPVYATGGTAQMLRDVGVPCNTVRKEDVGPGSAVDLIERGLVDLVINVPREYDRLGRPDGYLIRRRAVERGVPLITDLQLARAVVEALQWLQRQPIRNQPLGRYLEEERLRNTNA